MCSQRIAKTRQPGQQKAANLTFRSKKRAQSKLNPILQLHQTIGNQAVGKMIQSKLTIGQPGDKYEQEADRVAEQVIRMPNPQSKPGEVVSNRTQISRIQRLCPECEKEVRRQPVEEEEEPLQRQPLEEEEELQMQPVEEEEELQRQAGEEEEEETLAAKEISGRTPTVTPKVQANLNTMRGDGKPLPASVRAFFEPRFGQDFSAVRIHTDARAAETAQAVNSKAFTVGRNVVFATGQYSPDTSEGKRLLAHELTHVIQQNKKFPRGSENALRSGEKQQIMTSLPNIEIPPHRLPCLQRSIKFQAGKVFENVNLAKAIVERSLDIEMVPILNNTSIIAGKTSVAAVVGAFNKPGIKTQQVSAAGKKQTECLITSVPNNEASFKIVLPSNKKWRIRISKQKLADSFPKVNAARNCKDKNGDAYFTVTGDPDNKDIQKSSRVHEHRHKADYKKSFQAVAGAWDKKLSDAYTKKMSFRGPDAAECKKKLYRHVGGTPKETVIKIFRSYSGAAIYYHCNDNSCTALNFYDFRSNSNCDWLRAKVGTHPCKESASYSCP
jgi:hypothetical protein